ncbi:MAG: PAS domain S-box protein [Magnetovibrio sp.]|nr:PAS domain S-box protein [Magnetovibrio sp.]
MHPNRIAWKLIKLMIVFSSLITLVTTAVQLWSEYGRDTGAIQSRFVQVERSYIDSIAENVWESDTGRLDLLVSGIIEFPDFRYAMVRDDNGGVLAEAGAPVDKNKIRKVYPLHYTFRSTNLKIGELEVVASLEDVYNRAWDRVGLILVSNAIKTFLVAVFMFALVYWTLTRHLDVMAAFAQRIDLTLPVEPLNLDRGHFAGRRDEMDQLAESLNDMQGKLFRSYEELRMLNNDLEDRVLERTKAMRNEIEVRKTAEEKLEQSEHRLRDIAEAGADWLWEMGPDLRFTYVSEGRELFGDEAMTSIIGRTRMESAADTDDVDKWESHMDDLRNHRPFRDFQYLRKSATGQQATIRVSGKPVFDDQGTFQGYRGVTSDVTEVVEAKRKVALAENQLRILSSAMEQSPSMVFITDFQGDINYVNEKFVEVTGYSKEDVLGRNPRLLKSPDTPHFVHNDMWAKLKSGQEWRGEIKDMRKDGTEFWAYATIAPVKDENGRITHFVATHEDITMRKQADIQMREATKQAQLASRAKSELMANMSHELRTPLNAIIGFSDSMLSGVFGSLGNDRYVDYVRDIHASGQHLLELINDILDVSAIEAGKLVLRPEPLEMKTVATSCLKLVQHRANEAQVKLFHHVEKDIPDLLADERRVKQVLLNLLTNAVKFTPEDGQVNLNILLSPDGGLRFEVEDSGIGMDDQGIEKALSQFGQVDSRLSRRYEGTGLGLPLSKSLVEAHGGTLDIRSRIGHGTTVVVHFPKERTILGDRTVKGEKPGVSSKTQSSDTDAEGEKLASVSDDHNDKKTPTVH